RRRARARCPRSARIASRAWRRPPSRAATAAGLAGRDRSRPVSRVLFRRRIAPTPARIIRLGGALLRRSSALTRTPAPASRPGLGRAALGGVPIRACSGRGLPRRRSPGRRVGSYPTISPLPVPPPRALTRPAASPAIGGVVSVALSLGSPRVAVSDLPALWSPDFPPAGGVCPPAILRPTPVRTTVAPAAAPLRQRPARPPGAEISS